MEKEFVPYEESLELKELGFNEPCFGYYIELRNPSEGILTIDKCENNINGVLAPTFSQAFRWFRKKHDLFGTVQEKGYNHSRYYIHIVNGIWNPWHSTFDIYEEAELACLKRLIEIVKNK